ncbi:MAG: hypothetical protein ACFFB3_21120 [Candidatus Hodarchaeota archaeon]
MSALLLVDYICIEMIRTVDNPDSNMPDVLGLEIKGTIADITDRLRIQLEQGNVSLF